MKRLKFAWVGQLKAPFYAEACRHYLRALERSIRVEELRVRDARDPADIPARLRKEGQALLAGIGPRDFVVGLDERGLALDSKNLAARLGQWFDDPGRQPCFVLGGPFGVSPEVKARFDLALSLGPLTLPHELARTVLLEQLYRAVTILAGHPYHHD